MGRKKKVKAPQFAEPRLQVPFAPTLSALGLILISFTARVQENPVLVRSFWAAAAVLLLWNAVLHATLRSASAQRFLRLEFRAQHYIQAPVQLSVYLYWGYYWQPVYDYFWLLLAQLVFAYGFDMLLAWSRRETYVLGFGPFPIIFSTNLQPTDLADEAFLRRIPYKIEVGDPSLAEFQTLFKIIAKSLHCEYRQEAVDHLVEKHYTRVGRPLRRCQPRDLLYQIRNYCVYNSLPVEMRPEYFDRVVPSYFTVVSGT